MRSIKASLVDIHRILCAVLTPMPLVKVASLNILNHTNPSQTNTMSPLIFFSVAASKLGWI